MSFGPCIDLFCGAGGLSLGFVQAGFAIGLGVDVDAVALQTFGHNHPGVKILQEDVTRLNGEQLQAEIGGNSIFGIIGGPPCQGFSVAGKHDPNDPRNRLPERMTIRMWSGRDGSR
jgi:DNA (cytosine-5)-methyltransferase 1